MAHTIYDRYEMELTTRIERRRANPPPPTTSGYIHSQAAAAHNAGATPLATLRSMLLSQSTNLSTILSFAFGGSTSGMESLRTNRLLTGLKPSRVTTCSADLPKELGVRNSVHGEPCLSGGVSMRPFTARASRA